MRNLLEVINAISNPEKKAEEIIAINIMREGCIFI
jgi:hypothetical protein